MRDPKLAHILVNLIPRSPMVSLVVDMGCILHPGKKMFDLRLLFKIIYIIHCRIFPCVLLTHLDLQGLYSLMSILMPVLQLTAICRLSRVAFTSTLLSEGTGNISHKGISWGGLVAYYNIFKG